jgi:glycerate kinase
VHCDEQPVADGGEGTVDVLGHLGTPEEAHAHDAFGSPRTSKWLLLRDGTAVVEAAQVIPLDPSRLDVRAASSRGLGELIRAACTRSPSMLVVGLGGTANMDAGAGLLEALDALPVPTRVACDVRTRLVDAPRLYGPQKGATPAEVEELTRRFETLALPDVPGSGAAGGIAAALAVLGAELVPGAELVLELLRFDPSEYDLVVTGEGTVDDTTWEGKAPAAVLAACERAGVACTLFGGRVLGGDAVPLSGDPANAYVDLVTLASRLAQARATR